MAWGISKLISDISRQKSRFYFLHKQKKQVMVNGAQFARQLGFNCSCFRSTGFEPSSHRSHLIDEAAWTLDDAALTGQLMCMRARFFRQCASNFGRGKNLRNFIPKSANFGQKQHKSKLWEPTSLNFQDAVPPNEVPNEKPTGKSGNSFQMRL